MDPPGHLRIGELSRRVGISPELLRAWERRYGLLQPTRSGGGFRLYSDADELRVRRMQTHLQQGLSAAEAAQAAVAAQAGAELASTTTLADVAEALQEALERYDEQAANAVLDRTLSTFTTETVLSEIITPALRTLGDRWAAGELTIAHEHFASNLLRGRLLGIARGWSRGTGPIALLACPAGEWHDLPLLLFGIALRAAGWRIVLLGANTPIATIERAAETVSPTAVILATTMPGPLEEIEQELAVLATRMPIAIGGQAATATLANRTGALLLETDQNTAATTLAERIGQVARSHGPSS
jgi:MerR family transcriptional regulator, light-induced transcriptional regulator